MGWLPDGFEHPARVDLGTGHRLRPIRADDVEIDYPAVMGSRERLWAKYGEAWGWPRETMSHEAVVSWWVVDELVGEGVERALDAFVPRRLAETWRFERVDYSP